MKLTAELNHSFDLNKKIEKALLIGVVLPGMRRYEEEESLQELSLLADTAGAQVEHTLLQDRKHIHPSTLIGKGLVNQVAGIVQDMGINTVIFDTDLSPVQLKNLEKMINRKIIDRSGLILDIFAGHARTREAQIQVELAQLQYYLPRLTRQWTHLSRQEGGIGTRGPGETQLESDRRAVRKKITHLKNQLSKIEQQRDTRRKKRGQFNKIALVGYTNAGKSSLLNLLTGSDVFVEDQLFATLDATIRKMTLENFGDVLLIDTVGFIRKLPAHLIASFRSTLEETINADILMHVVDLSNANFEEQIGSVLSVLQDLKIDKKPVITVFNKIDLMKDRTILPVLKERFHPAVFISAVKGFGISDLESELLAVLTENRVTATIKIPIDQTKLFAQIHSWANVIEAVYDDQTVEITYQASEVLHERIQKMINHAAQSGAAMID